MVGMTLFSCLERWDELGSSATFNAAGGPRWEGAAGTDGSIDGWRQQIRGKIGVVLWMRCKLNVHVPVPSWRRGPWLWLRWGALGWAGAEQGRAGAVGSLRAGGSAQALAELRASRAGLWRG